MEEALLRLHAAVEVDGLWAGVREVVRSAVSCRRVTLFLGHLGSGRARSVLTDPPLPEASPEWYRERAALSPFSPYIDAHPGIPRYRFREVLPPPSIWRRSEFFRRFAAVEGWDKGVSYLYWERRVTKAMFSVYRGPGERDFSAAELRRLDQLARHIGVAIDRTRLLHGEQLSRQALERFHRVLPVGLLLLDWEGRVVFANAEALELCALWNFGEADGRALHPRRNFRLPEALQRSWREERQALETEARAGERARSSPVPGVPDWLGVGLTVLVEPARPVASPRFLFTLERREPRWPSTLGDPAAEAAGASRTRVTALHWISPREREVALLAADGASNGEIAARLGKSLLTVKTQLASIYRKLGVRSRTRMAAVLAREVR